jgi:hypothetical protein
MNTKSANSIIASDIEQGPPDGATTEHRPKVKVPREVMNVKITDLNYMVRLTKKAPAKTFQEKLSSNFEKRR